MGEIEQKTGFIASPVQTPDEVEAMRIIFNECLQFMSKPFAPITPEQQAKWWRDLPHMLPRFKAFVYRDPETLEIIAYSLLQWHSNGWVTPVWGLSSRARGRNLARQIIRHYISEAEGPLHGEELASHAAIVKLNREAGWQIVRTENGVNYLYHPGIERGR